MNNKSKKLKQESLLMEMVLQCENLNTGILSYCIWNYMKLWIRVGVLFEIFICF